MRKKKNLPRRRKGREGTQRKRTVRKRGKVEERD